MEQEKPKRRIRAQRAVPVVDVPTGPIVKPSDFRKMMAQWLPFAFTVVVAITTWLVSGVSATTSFKQQVVQIAAHQIEQDAKISRLDDTQKRLGSDFVPRLELTRQSDQQDIRMQRLEDKVDRILQNQATMQTVGRSGR